MTTKTASVQLLPVKLMPSHNTGVICTQYELPVHEWASQPRTPVSFVTLDDLAEQVAKLAADYGRGCCANIRVDGRKPPGFDRKFGRSLYFNLESEAA